MVESKDVLVTIILPVRNESLYIGAGLAAIAKQDYSSNCIEILIADGMSTDSTRKIIYEFLATKKYLNVVVLNNPKKIVPTGLNIALRKANGEIIIRADGHTTIAPDYIRQCVNVLKASGADNVGGRMNAKGVNPFGNAVALATSSRFGVGGARFHYSNQEEFVDTVYMGAWPRRVFEKIGLFDEEFVRDQDDEFNYRLREAGGKILLSPKIRSEYIVRSTPAALWRQYYQYGFWKVRVMQKHPRQMKIRHFVPPAFALTIFMSALSLILPYSSPLPFIVPFMYILANVVVSTSNASKDRRTDIFLLFFVFAILHLSYGIGFLVGLVRFWDRWSDRVGSTVPELA